MPTGIPDWHFLLVFIRLVLSDWYSPTGTLLLLLSYRHNQIEDLPLQSAVIVHRHNLPLHTVLYGKHRAPTAVLSPSSSFASLIFSVIFAIHRISPSEFSADPRIKSKISGKYSLSRLLFFMCVPCVCVCML